jgi:hypothetical protein
VLPLRHSDDTAAAFSDLLKEFVGTDIVGRLLSEGQRQLGASLNSLPVDGHLF